MCLYFLYRVQKYSYTHSLTLTSSILKHYIRSKFNTFQSRYKTNKKNIKFRELFHRKTVVIRFNCILILRRLQFIYQISFPQFFVRCSGKFIVPSIFWKGLDIQTENEQLQTFMLVPLRRSGGINCSCIIFFLFK